MTKREEGLAGQIAAASDASPAAVARVIRVCLRVAPHASGVELLAEFAREFDNMTHAPGPPPGPALGSRRSVTAHGEGASGADSYDLAAWRKNEQGP